MRAHFLVKGNDCFFSLKLPAFFFFLESKHKSLSTQPEVFLGVLNEKGFRMEEVFWIFFIIRSIMV